MTGNKWVCTRCKALNAPQDDYERGNCGTCYTRRDKKTRKKEIVPKNTNLREGEEEKKEPQVQADDDYETPQHILNRVQGKKKGKYKGGGKKKK